MILDILKYPDPRLKEVGEPVTSFDAGLHKLLDDMATTMYAAEGIGLAATQVGRKLRLFLIDLGPQDSSPGKLMEFINPTLKEAQGKISFEEGCLSVPGFTEEINRSEAISVDFQDRWGNKKTLRAEGLLAVAIQHENDHLDGIVFVEKLSPLKRRMLKKKIQKAVTL